MPARRSLRPVDVLLFLGAACWGSTYFFVKELLPDPAYAPVLISTRMLISAAVLALFVTVRRGGRATRAEVRSGILLGLPLSVVFGLETYGVALTSATNAGVLVALCIVFVPFAEAAVRRTRVQRTLVALCGAAVVGAAMLAGGGFTPPGLGDVLVFGAALARVAHVTLSSSVQAKQRLDPYRLTAIQLATVGVTFAVFSAVVGAPAGDFFASLDAPSLLILLYLSVVAGAFVFAVQTWGIATTSAAHASLLLGTEPVWAAIFGLLLAGDRLELIGIAGIVVTLTAVLAAQRISARTAREAGRIDTPRARMKPATTSASS